MKLEVLVSFRGDKVEAIAHFAKVMVHFNHSPRFEKVAIFQSIVPTGTIFGKPEGKELTSTICQAWYNG